MFIQGVLLKIVKLSFHKKFMFAAGRRYCDKTHESRLNSMAQFFGDEVKIIIKQAPKITENWHLKIA